jgi:hypothetical protein
LDRHIAALENIKKVLEIHGELQDKVERAEDYLDVRVVRANIKDHKAAIESHSKALEILQELEENTGYHHPLNDTIQVYFTIRRGN